MFFDKLKRLRLALTVFLLQQIFNFFCFIFRQTDVSEISDCSAVGAVNIVENMLHMLSARIEAVIVSFPYQACVFADFFLNKRLYIGIGKLVVGNDIRLFNSCRRKKKFANISVSLSSSAREKHVRARKDVTMVARIKTRLAGINVVFRLICKATPVFSVNNCWIFSRFDGWSFLISHTSDHCAQLLFCLV